MTTEQRTALLAITDAVIDAVRQAGPMGAPGGHIYAALMGVGITLSQYQQIMGALVGAGKLRQSGECYFVAARVAR